MCDNTKLLYQADMARFNIADSCPCEYCHEVEELPAFRYMYDRDVQQSDFIPQILKPGRPPYRVRPGQAQKTCEQLGLSFYATASAALTNFQAAKGFPNMNPAYTCIGRCVLTLADGVVDKEIRGDGHFNVHPYMDAPMQTGLVFDSSLTV